MIDWHTPDDICLSADLAQMDYFKELIGQYGQNQVLHDDLGPFKEKYAFTNVDTPEGVVTFPSDYEYLLNIWTVVFSNTEGSIPKKVQLVNEDELIEAITSKLRPVSVNRPIGLPGDNKVQLYPITPQAGYAIYLRKPLAPVYVYTLSGPSNRTVTYNHTGSQDLEWNDFAVNKIVYKTLEHLGVNMDEDKLVQYGKMKADDN